MSNKSMLSELESSLHSQPVNNQPRSKSANIVLYTFIKQENVIPTANDEKNQATSRSCELAINGPVSAEPPLIRPKKIKKFTKITKEVRAEELHQRLTAFTVISRRKRNFDNIKKCFLNHEEQSVSKELLFHPVKKKIKLNHHNTKVKLLAFESERKETSIRCFKDNDLFKNTDFSFLNLLKKTKGDNDADTTESVKQQATKLCYDQLLEAVKKCKTRNKLKSQNFAPLFDTFSMNSEKSDPNPKNKKISSSVKSRKYENQQEFETRKKYIKNDDKSERYETVYLE